LHGLKLLIEKEVLPMKDQLEFPSLELLAVQGLLAPDSWIIQPKKRARHRKSTSTVVLLTTVIVMLMLEKGQLSGL